MAFTLGLGTNDFLKLAKPVAPIGFGGLKSAGSTVFSGKTGPTAPTTTPSPIPTPTPGPTTSTTSMGYQSTLGANPMAPSPYSPPPIPTPTPPTTSWAPSSSTTPPTPAPIINQDVKPQQADVPVTPQPVLTQPDLKPQQADVYANPWDDPNYQEPTPPPASMYQGQGAAMTTANTLREKDTALANANQQGAGTAEGGGDGVDAAKAKAAADAAANNPATPPASTVVPPTTAPFDDQLAHYQDIATQWANGQIDDKVFRTSINRAIMTLGLNNQAERDALQMHINQDPNLKGQGAGMAMLQMLGAQQNFNADQMFGQLASDSQQRILDLQKYGVEEGTKITQQRQQNAFDYITQLQNAGNYDQAAANLNKTLGLAPGTISGADVKSRDPYMQTQLGEQFKQITDTMLTDPNKGEALLAAFMMNPATKDWFAPGLTAKDVASSIVSGDFAQNQARITQMETTINGDAKSNAPFLKALDSYKAMGPQAWATMVKTGQGMNVADLNKARVADGLSGDWTTDSHGNIVDKNGNAITDEDFGEAAAMADYQRRTHDVNEAPWDHQVDMILKSSAGADILKIPGAETTLRKFFMAQSFGSFTKDPVTGLLVPSGDYGGDPTSNPKISYLFHTWPKTAFDANGNPTGPVYQGGDPYGMTLAGEEIHPSPDDQTLDSKYAAYLNNTPSSPLSQQQWYFATAGGVKPADESKIPGYVKPPTPPPPGPPAPGPDGGPPVKYDGIDNLPQFSGKGDYDIWSAAAPNKATFKSGIGSAANQTASQLVLPTITIGGHTVGVGRPGAGNDGIKRILLYEDRNGDGVSDKVIWYLPDTQTYESSVPGKGASAANSYDAAWAQTGYDKYDTGAKT